MTTIPQGYYSCASILEFTEPQCQISNFKNSNITLSNDKRKRISEPSQMNTSNGTNLRLENEVSYIFTRSLDIQRY